MRYDNQLRYALRIVKEYDGRYPLSAWLKDFFRENKQMGSRDRKTVSGLVYGYFRLGHLAFESPEQKVLTGLFLSDGHTDIIAHFRELHPALVQQAHELRSSVLPENIFPWIDKVSSAIDPQLFTQSFFVQPDLFLRLRPGCEQQVLQKLSAANISHRRLSPSCLSLDNATKLEGVILIDKEVVVQDKNSQRTADLLSAPGIHSVWDCCAASGGKSIMAFDSLPGIELTVSDKRDSILSNLRLRFGLAGISNYRSFTADLTDRNDQLPAEQYDLIIADLPCSGSGTWSRTPEQLSFFKEEQINYYTQLQQRILQRVIPYLRTGGSLLYITCSVFAKENEEQVDFAVNHCGLRLQKMEWFKGYAEKADTLFGALLTN